MISLSAFLSSVGLVFVSEMADKTQFLALTLALRLKRPWAVMGGILIATLANHLLAASVGDFLTTLVPARIMLWVLAVLFAGFGVWALVPDQPVQDDADSQSWIRSLGPVGSTAVLFFLAEMGDKTQFATLALAARFRSVFWVTAGTTLGMLAADGIVVFLGHQFADKIPLEKVRLVSALFFFGFALFAILAAL